MANSRKVLLMATTLLLAAGTTRAADKGAAPPPKPDVAASVSPDLQKLLQVFKSKRDSLLADREALLEQLKNATAEQRQQILDKMQTQQKELVEAQRALGKQIRDEMRKLRESTPASHR